MPKKIADATSQITVRIDDDILKRIRALSVRLSRELGTSFGRSDVLRAVILRGLHVMERQYGKK